MKIKGKKIYTLIKRKYKGRRLMWELWKGPWIVYGLSYIGLFGILYYRLLDDLSAAYSPLTIGPLLIITILLGISLPPVQDSCEFFRFVQIEEIKSDYKEKQYRLTFSCKIKDVKIAEDASVKVFTPSGYMFFARKETINATDIGKSLVSSTTFYETEMVLIGIRSIYHNFEDLTVN